MTPPAGPGQASVLCQHYGKNGDAPVAFIDETYHLQTDGRDRFYTMAAVVVNGDVLDPLRDDLRNLVPSGWWHTSEALRTPGGRNDALLLLGELGEPGDACVVVDHVDLDKDDSDGMKARGEVMRRLLTTLHEGQGSLLASVGLAVAEENRVHRVNNFDRSVRSTLIKEGGIPETMGLVHASPGSERLLWLPDLVCSAYRQKKLGRGADLFERIDQITHVALLPGAG